MTTNLQALLGPGIRAIILQGLPPDVILMSSATTTEWLFEVGRKTASIPFIKIETLAAQEDYTGITELAKAVAKELSE